MFLVLLQGVVPSLRALTPVTDGPAERGPLITSVRQFFEADEFALLERMAAKLWAEQTRFTDGTWKLGEFFRAFSASTQEGARVDWDAMWARFDRWETKVPGSELAKILRARAMVSWAWAARGGGYADTVPEKGWKDFGERLQAARRLLESDPSLRDNIGYYYAMIPIAQGEGWSRPQMESLFTAAVKLAPDFESVYFGKATFLQLKWYGRPGEWQKFAADAVELTREKHGEAFYARVVWSVLGTTFRGTWAEQGVDWARMKQGFEDLMRETPESKWNLSAYCYYACRAGDRETAARLFEQLGDAYAPGLWRTEKMFENYRQWAKGRASR